jgi:hypothetical protein
MKILVLFLFLSFSQNLQAIQCGELFQTSGAFYDYRDQEFTVINDPTSEHLKDIMPETQGLLLDEKIDTGDLVYIQFIKPLDPQQPNATNGAKGYIIGSQMVTNEKGHTNLHYFLLTVTTSHLISFTNSMINFEHSQLVKKEYGRTLH